MQSSKEHDTCCYLYHMDFKSIYDVFRPLVGHKRVIPTSSHDFNHFVLYPREDDALYHPLDYVDGTCNTCGNLALVPCVPQDHDEVQMVHWQQYEYVTHLER